MEANLSTGDFGAACMPPADFRSALHAAADLAADFLEHMTDYPVIPRIVPGEVRGQLPASGPQHGEPMSAILDDYRRLIEPHLTHWSHPGFLAYFPNTGSGPGIIGELLAAAVNNNAMLWRTGPAAAELEQVVCDWLRQWMRLPGEFRGHINDTASISSLLGLAAARHIGAPDVRERGLAGAGPLTVYASEHAHSSIDKAVALLGLGLQNLRKVPADAEFRLVPAALAEMIAADIERGCQPIAVVATVGTTSTTSVDPVAEVAAICRQRGIWLHVDAAYAGAAAICPEHRAQMTGIEAADSLVINPHKWLLVPMDCSVLFVRDEPRWKSVFSLVAHYLTTGEANSVTNLMDLGIQLGRRFRALKMWMVFRTLGLEGLQAHIRQHCALATEFAGWVRGTPGFEVVAPVPFSTVCFRATPQGTPADQDAFNVRLEARVNAAGPVFISHTQLNGRYVLRLAIGNANTRREHLEAAWKLVVEAVRE